MGNSSGRDAKGRFLAGNTHVRAPKFAALGRGFRERVQRQLTDDDIRHQIRAMHNEVVDCGNVQACRLLWEFMFGKPGEIVEDTDEDKRIVSPLAVTPPGRHTAIGDAPCS